MTDAQVAVDPAIRAELEQLAQADARRELFFLAEVLRLQKQFDAVDVPVRVLKGVAVAKAIIGRFGLRYNHDIDLLVPRDAFDQACQVLELAGYVRVIPGPEVSPRQVRSWRRLHKDMTFRHAEHGALIELHWRLLDNPALLTRADPMDNPQVLHIAGAASIKTLSRELTFVYMVLHGAEHAWSRLKWLIDLGALLAAEDEAGVARLHAEAVALGTGRSAEVAIILSAEIFGTPLPPHIGAALASRRRIRWLCDISLRSLAGDGGAREMEDQPFATTLKNLSHYLLADGLRYWFWEFVYDLKDSSATEASDAFRYLGPAARPAAWISRQATLMRGARAEPIRRD